MILLRSTFDLFLQVIEILIIVRVLISWFPVSEENKFVSFLDQMTEPILAPIRSLLQRSETTRNLMIDFSPIVAIIIIGIIRWLFLGGSLF